MKHLLKSVLVAAGLFLTVGAVDAQQKIGHVNSQEILLLMPEYKTANQGLETFIGTKRTEFQQMDTERQKKITAFLDKQKSRSEANKTTVDQELQTMSTEIQQMEGRMNDVQEKAQQEIGAKREELFQPVFAKAEQAIQAVAKEKGYAYILDVGQQSAVLYFDGGEDISPAVKTKLGIDPNAKPAAPATPAPGAPAGANPAGN